MAVETERTWQRPERRHGILTFLRRRLASAGRAARTVANAGFSTLSRRIIILNLGALLVLVSGFLYMNQFREGLIDARVQSLLTQGEIIAAAIASSSISDTNTITIDPQQLLELDAGESLAPVDEGLSELEFPINPERVAPILRRLILPVH